MKLHNPQLYTVRRYVIESCNHKNDIFVLKPMWLIEGSESYCGKTAVRSIHDNGYIRASRMYIYPPVNQRKRCQIWFPDNSEVR